MPCLSCGSEKKIVARGWCRACYSRWYNKGTTAYSVKPEKVGCSVGGCNDSVIAKGMCDKHYRRMKKHGDVEDAGPVDWGKRSKHPLYSSWKWMRRHKSSTPVCKEWLDDFWAYAFDVGERPSIKHKLWRADSAKPLGPDNFVWKRSLTERAAGEDEKTYKARHQRNNRRFRPEAHQGYGLKKLYGLSKDEYDDMLESQNHKCKICGAEERMKIRGKTVRLAVDHCHSTNRIRGLLCTKCNQGLGCLGDSVTTLKAAITYLQNF